MGGSDEPLGDRHVEPREEQAPVVADIEQADRLAVELELRPRHDLGQLFERPEPTGQRDERIGEVGHLRLALVQRVDDA